VQTGRAALIVVRVESPISVPAMTASVWLRMSAAALSDAKKLFAVPDWSTTYFAVLLPLKA